MNVPITYVCHPALNWNIGLVCEVEGDSMEPTLKRGDKVRVDMTKVNYRFGDIVLIDWGSTYVIHRLIIPKKSLTKGDNLRYADPNGLKVIGYVRSIDSFRERIRAIASLMEGRIPQETEHTCLKKMELRFWQRVKRSAWGKWNGRKERKRNI